MLLRLRLKSQFKLLSQLFLHQFPSLSLKSHLSQHLLLSRQALFLLYLQGPHLRSKELLQLQVLISKLSVQLGKKLLLCLEEEGRRLNLQSLNGKLRRLPLITDQKKLICSKRNQKKNQSLKLKRK